METPKKHRTLDGLRADHPTAGKADTLLARLTALMRERDIPGDPEAEREAVAVIEEFVELTRAD
jgi:hypothetical protein